MDLLLEGFECYHWRGSRRSVIQPEEMIAGTKDNLIGCLAAKLRHTPGGWSPTKERMRQHLERLTYTHGYEGNLLDYRDYQLTRVGQSFLYDVPIGKRRFSASSRGNACGWCARRAVPSGNGYVWAFAHRLITVADISVTSLRLPNIGACNNSCSPADPKPTDEAQASFI